jgi:7-carboxy-7-deazaguanine synthase
MGARVTFTVHELFYTLQGEGQNVGRPAVFCRFAGCNLWTGREEDRADAVCRFCDTEFRGGTKYRSVGALATAIRDAWPGGKRPLVVFTGGEPLLQLTGALTEAVHWAGFEVAVETNGTQHTVPGIDWLTVSPKARAPLTLTHGDELKLVYPQGPDPAEYLALDFRHFWLQPMDGPDVEANTRAAADYCMANPPWRLSLQTHKVAGLR